MRRIELIGIFALIAISVACGQTLPDGCSSLVDDPQFTLTETRTGRCYDLSGTVVNVDDTRYARPTTLVLVVAESSGRTLDVSVRPENAGGREWAVGNDFNEIVLVAPRSTGDEVVHFYLRPEQ